MEPFIVICETCRARLKVRDASAIGEIHACPKCESMVLIAPPAGWSVQPPAVVASEPLKHSPDFAHVICPSEDAADAFAEAAALAARPKAESASETNAADPVAAASLQEAGTPSWMTTIAGSKLLAGSLLGFMILLAGGVALTVVSDGKTPEVGTPLPSAVVSEGKLDPHASLTDGESLDTIPKELQTANESIQPVEIVAAKPPSDPVDETTSPVPLESPRSEDSSAGYDEPSIVAADAGVTSPAPETETLSVLPLQADPPLNNQSRAPVLKFDPLDFDPSQLSLAATSAANNEVATGSVTDKQPDAVDEPVVSEDTRPNVADVLQPLAENPSVTVRLGPMVRDESEPQSTAKPWALRVDSFTAADMPLERLLAQVSDMAGVPITLDPAAFELSAVTPRVPVTVNSSEVTLGQLLNEVLSKHRLEVVELTGQLRIALANSDERSSKTHDVTELLDAGATDARSIAALIERFVSPTTWHAAGGTGTIEAEGSKLRVDQTKAVHHEIVVFCERLRLARGLRQRTRYPANLLAIDSPYHEMNSKLAARTTFTFLPWARLADVVRHWEQQAGVTILVDWANLAREELTPSTPLTCSAVDQPWNAALEQILEPLGLAWWAVDSGTIAVTTPAAIDGIQRTEFLVVSPAVREQFGSGPKLVESLNSEMLKDGGSGAAANDTPPMHFDVASGRLIVRGTPRVLRFVAEQLIGPPRP